MKVASFSVKATVDQSARWKRAAEAEGYASVGAWASRALDAYLKQRLAAGAPVPLAWRRGTFRVQQEHGETAVRGYLSPPFGAYYGTPAGQPLYRGACRFTLVYLPAKRILATVETYAQCKALAAELARIWVRWDGTGAEPPSQKPGTTVAQHLEKSK